MTEHDFCIWLLGYIEAWDKGICVDEEEFFDKNVKTQLMKTLYGKDYFVGDEK